MKKLPKGFRSEILRQYIKSTIKPGVDLIPASGKVFDEQELYYAIQAVLDGWWTEGRFAKQFEKDLAKYLAVKYVSLTNSGSSANLLAISALTSAQLGKKALKPGDEIITAATAFPTTVNPIIQNKCIPVFVDCDLETKNPRIVDIKKAITKKTKAIISAHTLGNPLPLEEIIKLVKKYDLWFIEDCCDALGSKYKTNLVGSFGHIATFSFYPAHHITMGEGGAVVTNNPVLHRLIRQFRDWGRDCWCDTGKDNTCGKRFCWKLGKLPYGYDHKYVYSQIGYNLKITDMQAAIGLAQLKKLPKFVKKRRQNFTSLYDFFQPFKHFFVLPKEEKHSQASWFGFPLVIKNQAPFSKLDLISFLEKNKVATRSIFSGNLLKHPAYCNRTDIKSPKSLSCADKIMHNGFWIGVYPGLGKIHLQYIKKILKAFLNTYKS